METLKTPSRLHLSLIDLEGSLGRVDGGIGIALEEPCFEIDFEKSTHIEGLVGDAKRVAEKICTELNVDGIKVRVRRSIPNHVGFGSKTQFYLAIVAGVCRVYGIKKPVRKMAYMVGRGGTSGIGVAAFESGGFILDGGHAAEKGFKPSRFSSAPPPPVLARYDFPWWIVCAWPERKGAHGKRERDIFRNHCPIQGTEVAEVSRIVLMKILPALVERNLKSFGQGINLLQKTGFKKVEVGLHDGNVRKLLQFFQKNSAGGGMSSFGPVCFGLCGSKSEARSLGEDVKGEFDFNTIATKANNQGAKWL